MSLQRVTGFRWWSYHGTRLKSANLGIECNEPFSQQTLSFQLRNEPNTKKRKRIPFWTKT